MPFWTMGPVSPQPVTSSAESATVAKIIGKRMGVPPEGRPPLHHLRRAGSGKPPIPSPFPPVGGKGRVATGAARGENPSPLSPKFGGKGLGDRGLELAAGAEQPGQRLADGLGELVEEAGAEQGVLELVGEED